MPVRFFGQFLLENGVIDARQLLAAITYQEKTNLKFGDTAIRLGLLDEQKLAKIFALQRSEDLKSGEAAVKLGLLTQQQVDQVLRAQKNSHVMIGEALVKTGALDEQKLSRQLELFKKEQDPYTAGASTGVPKDKDKTGLAGPAVDLAMKFLVRLANFSVKLLSISETLAMKADGDNVVARVGFTGDIAGEIALVGPERLCARIASAMLGEPVKPGRRDAIVDATCEFLNVVGGNLSAAAARDGKKLELSAPQGGELPAPGKNQQRVVARLGTPDGEVDFVFLAGAS